MAKKKGGVVQENTEMLDVEIKCILPGDNVRKDEGKKVKEEMAALVENIRLLGLLNPITVRPEWQGNGAKSDKYVIVAGNRRLEAVKALGWDKIPVRITTDENEVFKNLAENVARTNVHPMHMAKRLAVLCRGDEAKGIPPLGKNLEEASEKASKLCGFSPVYVRMLIRCAEKLSPVVQAYWEKHPDELGVRKIQEWLPLAPEEQDAMLDEYTGGEKQTRGAIKRKPKKGVRSMRAKKEIVAAIEEANGARKEALQWVLGERKSWD